MSMSLNINIHHPEVQQDGIRRDVRLGGLVVTLNDGPYYAGSVALFMSDAEFDAIVDAVDTFRRLESADVSPWSEDVLS